ncbi:MAG TPA: hypothetical protein VIM58_02920, partial [Candidatus Methylacidiphilales bacterium]
TTAVAYLNYLATEGFLDKQEMNVLSAPGLPALPPGIPLSDRFIAFTLFRVAPDDPPGTVFLIAKPRASKGAIVVITKDGEAHTYKRKDALDPLEQYIASGSIPAAMPLESKTTSRTP